METSYTSKKDKSLKFSKIEEINTNEKKSKKDTINYQYIFKIILIGDQNIGKTSLISRYVTNCFTDKYICTIGVDFMMKSISFENQTIKLQIWDTAGMEKYKQITTSYYKGTQAAIICFDLTNKNSFNSVRRWYSEFSNYYNPLFEKTVILVGNKSDLEDEREVIREEIENLCNLNNFVYYETSAKTGDNVECLFDEIAKRLYFSYKNHINGQIRDAVKIRKSSGLSGADKFQNLILMHEKKKKCC
jgi:small GTP-binding protein